MSFTSCEIAKCQARLFIYYIITKFQSKLFIALGLTKSQAVSFTACKVAKHLANLLFTSCEFTKIQARSFILDGLTKHQAMSFTAWKLFKIQALSFIPEREIIVRPFYILIDPDCFDNIVSILFSYVPLFYVVFVMENTI